MTRSTVYKCICIYVFVCIYIRSLKALYKQRCYYLLRTPFSFSVWKLAKFQQNDVIIFFIMINLGRKITQKFKICFVLQVVLICSCVAVSLNLPHNEHPESVQKRKEWMKRKKGITLPYISLRLLPFNVEKRRLKITWTTRKENKQKSSTDYFFHRVSRNWQLWLSKKPFINIMRKFECV